MSNLNQFLEFANEAAQTEDQTVIKEGVDYEYTPPPAGKSAARLISYVELGKRKQ